MRINIEIPESLNKLENIVSRFNVAKKKKLMEKNDFIGQYFWYENHQAEVIANDGINGYMCWIPSLGKHVWLQEWEIKQGME